MATIKMPTSAEIAKEYEDAIPRVAAKYKLKIAGVTDFKDKAIKGQTNYVTQMTKPDVLKRREDALNEMPPDTWKKGADEKGAVRIGPGMTAAKDKRTRNYESIRSGLDGLTIADRTPDWEANVEGRLKPVVRKMKEIAGKA